MKRWICLLLILVCLPVSGALGEETLRVVDLNACPEAIKLFSSRYPDVQLEGADTLFDSQETFITHLMIQDSTIDIYAITVSMGLKKLKEKSYLPVIASPLLEEEIAGWYPAIQECLTTSQGVVAIPYDLMTNQWGVNPDLWAQLFPGKSLDTWMDYLQLAAAWQENEAWQEEYTLTMSGLTQMDVARRLVRSYITYYETDEVPLSFDQPAFLECLEALRTLPEDQDAPEDSEAWNEQLNRPTVIQETMENIGSNAGMGDSFVAIPEPRFTQEDAPVLQGEMRMYVINPYSEHEDLAIRFLETVVEAMPQQMKIRFSPAVEAPIENPYWAKRQAQIAEEMSALEQLPELTEAAQIRLDSLRWAYQNESDRYLVTQAEKERYQELTPYLRFHLSSNFLGFQNGSNVDALLAYVERYLSGYLSLDACIQEMNRVSAQIYYEQ